jgi:hypothetical protein
MTYLKQNKLGVAISAALIGAAATPAYAVNLSDNGLGDVGLVSYYTARNNTETQLSIVNTSDDYVVAVKLRFREGDNSRDARDFNIFLSPNDVWTAGVTMGDDGETPLVRTFDNSCTAPALLPSPNLPGGTEVSFTNGDYVTDQNSNNDGGPTSIERTQDGHFEVIVMGVDLPEQGTLAAGAVHVNGVPADCDAIRNDYLPAPTGTGGATLEAQFDEPLNVIKVSANLINVEFGVAGGIPVDMLANFFNPGNPAQGIPVGQENYNFPGPDDLMQRPDLATPNLAFALPAQATQITEMGAITDDFAPNSADAVSSLFMANAVLNEYDVSAITLSETDWVITFPTKQFYVDVDNTTANGLPNPAPFENFFQPDGTSCVAVDFGYYDREEANVENQAQLDFSPRPPGTPGDSICEETQVVQFADGALGAGNAYGVPLEPGFEQGWMRLSFVGSGAPNELTVQGATYTYSGLPVTGFALRTLENGVSSSGGILNYGIVTEHAYWREITPAVVTVP